MDTSELRAKMHEIDATVRVGKSGIESVSDELDEQLKHRDVVKVKFLRAARGGTSTDELAEELAEAFAATMFEARGNTAVYYR